MMPRVRAIDLKREVACALVRLMHLAHVRHAAQVLVRLRASGVAQGGLEEGAGRHLGARGSGGARLLLHFEGRAGADLVALLAEALQRVLRKAAILSAPTREKKHGQEQINIIIASCLVAVLVHCQIHLA